MNDSIRKYLHYLQSGHITEETFLETLHYFLRLSSNTAVISDNIGDVAALFYNVLRIGGRVYEDVLKKDNDGLPKSVKENLFIGFGNIERLYIEAIPEEENSSFVNLVHFLSELKTKKDKQKSPDINRNFLENNIDVLLDVLNDISYIFDATYEDEIVFPINSIIASVIGDKGFIAGRKKLNEKDIKLLQLAVRLFQNDPEDSEILSELIEKCNLRFINYLGTGGYIIDTANFDNYRYNGTIIFHDSVNKRVLIRNEDEDYFNLPEGHDYEVKSEHDYEGNVFCWFAEFGLENRRLQAYSKLMGNEQFAKSFLRLLYDQKKHNVFIDNSILIDDTGNIDSVNPFCSNDRYVIKETKSGRTEIRQAVDGITEAIGEYRACSLRENIMNRLTIGICALLLDINNVGVDALGLDSLSNDRWYQEQVIHNWMSQENIDEADLQSLLYKWFDQLQYCENDKAFEEYEFGCKDFLPLQQPLDDFMRLIAPNRYEEESIYSGTVAEITDDDGECYYEINASLADTISGKEYRATGNKSLVVSCEDLDDITEGIDWGRYKRQTVYYSFSVSAGKGHIADQQITKLLAALEQIMTRSLSFEVGDKVSQHDLQDAYRAMSMYKKAYHDFARRSKAFSNNDFETQASMRLLHNLIWSHVSTENVSTYFDIIRGHEFADFEDIADDHYFSRPSEKALYLMKDNINQNSVMSDVYSIYIKEGGHRNEHPLYLDKVSKNDEGKFTIKGNVIEKIVFLTDNFIYGTSTIAALAAYYGMNNDQVKDYFSERRLQEAVSSIERFSCEGNQVSVLDIIVQNGGMPISVHGYYGTDKGKDAIKKFMDNNGIAYDQVDYYKGLDQLSVDVSTMARKVWQDKAKDISGKYPVFREFSMPKATVFPDKMLSLKDGDINKAICMYVKREELNSARASR